MRKKTGSPFALRRNDRFRLIGLGLLAGSLGAVVSILYRLALSHAEKLRTAAFSQIHGILGVLLLFAALIVIGILVGKTVESEPMISGSGIPQVEGQLLGYFSPRWAPVLLKKFIAGTLSILCGLSLGREGPSIQLGAMAAQGFCEKTHRGAVESKYLITCGGCAGLAAAFQAPLSGLMFGLEEIHKNFSSRALFSAVAACLAADILSSAVFGNHSVLGLKAASEMPLTYYPLILAAGVFFGLCACIYNKVLFGLKRLYKKLPFPTGGRILIPFLLTGFVGLFYPELLGSGDAIIHEMASGNHLLTALLILLIAKFLFSMLCFCSGAPGGIFFPMLVLGALCGSLFGEAACLIFRLEPSCVFPFMLFGMAGLFAGIVRAPLTGILLVVEMSGSLTQLFGLATAAFLACLTADFLHSKPVYEQLLEDIIPPETVLQEPTELSLLELTVSYRSPLAGRTLSELPFPENCLMVSITRSGHQIIPHGTTGIQGGDLLTLVCPAGQEAAVKRALGYGLPPDAENHAFL